MAEGIAAFPSLRKATRLLKRTHILMMKYERKANALPHHSGSDHIVHIGNSIENPLAAITAIVSIPQLDGFILTR
jgi:hypothetical protein